MPIHHQNTSTYIGYFLKSSTKASPQNTSIFNGSVKSIYLDESSFNSISYASQTGPASVEVLNSAATSATVIADCQKYNSCSAELTDH